MLIRDSSFEIQPVTRDDWKAVLDVYRQCEDFLALGPEPIATENTVLTDIEVSQREGGIFCGIYVPDGQMIGIVDFIPSNFDGDPRLAFLSLLMIAAPFRKRGAGTRTVGMIEREIMKHSPITAILSAVQVNNRQALRFWQKMGYRIVGGPELQPDQTVTFHLRKECSQETQDSPNVGWTQ